VRTRFHVITLNVPVKWGAQNVCLVILNFRFFLLYGIKWHVLGIVVLMMIVRMINFVIRFPVFQA
jgi:hypothetical protein